MQLQLLPDLSQFNIKDVTVAGDDCYLITPKDMGVKWTEDNKHFRSSVWRKSDLELVSPLFRKFTNYGEQPGFEPITSFQGAEIVQKLDGSLLGVTKYKNELIIRTRGTIDARSLDNGSEIDIFLKKYPKIFQKVDDTFTLLFEWTTPSNRIVLKESEEPKLWLIGGINHKDYSYFHQTHLDTLAEEIEVERPKRYNLSFDEIKEFLKDNKTIEGVVIYTDNSQILKKLKTEHYVQLHRICTGIRNTNNVIEIFIAENCPPRDVFEKYISNTIDWEFMLAITPFINELYSKWDNIQLNISKIKQEIYIDSFKSLDRKQQASIIISKFGKWKNIAFTLLDNKTPDSLKLFNLLD